MLIAQYLLALRPQCWVLEMGPGRWGCVWCWVSASLRPRVKAGGFEDLIGPSWRVQGQSEHQGCPVTKAVWSTLNHREKVTLGFLWC